MNQETQKITAYALGELQGKEKDDFEKELANSPELQMEVDAIRSFTANLEKELQAEECPALNEEQRQNVLLIVVDQLSRASQLFY